MSTCERRRRSRAANADGGFTLVEVMVALGLLMVVLAATLPAFLAMVKAGTTARMQAQAKNLAQERLEQIRDLRFHVDRQNGPFLDLLDLYYTNASTAGSSTTVNVGPLALVGTYVPTAAASGGLPAGPYYKTVINSICVDGTSCPAGTSFVQTIALQFLQPSGAPVPASRFENTYDSQTVGGDAPPSSTVGVTVVTSWTQAGQAKSYRTYTRVTESRPAAPLIQTQARAVAVDITSTAADGTTVELQGGVSSADGAQSSGSSVSGYATGAVATRTGYAAVSGQAVQFSLPTQAASTSGSVTPQSAGSGCSWYAFGKTTVTNGGGDVSTGLPKSPTNVDGTTPPAVMTGALVPNGSSTCGLLSYDNTVGGGVARGSSDNVGQVMGTAPFVSVPDTTGSTPVVSGATYVTSNALTASPQKSQAGAQARATQPVVLFPGYGASGGRGLVSVTLTSAQVDCTSATTSGAVGAVTGKYVFTLGWWGRGQGEAAPKWHSRTYDYDSTRSTPLNQSGDTWDPANTAIGNGLTLSQVVTGPSAGFALGAVSAGATDASGSVTGLRGFAGGVLTLTTASTLLNETGAGYSSIKVQIGQLTCVADDQR